MEAGCCKYAATRGGITLKFVQKITALLIALLLLTAMIPTVFAEDNDNGVVFHAVSETVYATANVNVRSGPGKNFKRVGMLDDGDSIKRIGIGQNGWSKVVFKGKTAYIHSDYLSKLKTTGADYTLLSRQISVASGLKEVNYTAETWDVLEDALLAAKDAMKSKKQKTVDDCAKALEEAMTQLVATDRSALQDALEDASAFASADLDHQVWFDLIEAVQQGEALLGGNNQEAMDATAKEINALLMQVKTVLEQLNTPKIVTQEVPVEVPPTDDYCNIPKHRVWPVVCVCSLVLNVALVAAIVMYIAKKKNQKDDTPLVDYDISDDMF